MSHCGVRHPAGSEPTDQQSWPASGSQRPHLLITYLRPPEHILTWIKTVKEKKGKEEKKGGRKESRGKKKKRNEGSLEGRSKEGERVGGRAERKGLCSSLRINENGPAEEVTVSLDRVRY